MIDPNIAITFLSPSHAEQVAALHVQGIRTGFISSLGLKFVTSLYESIASSESCFGCIAQKDKQVIGFVTFASDMNSLYRSVIKKKGFRFALLLAKNILSWKNIKQIFQTLLYPGKTQKMDLPAAELLAVVVDEKARGRGLARTLIEKGLLQCQNRNIDKVKLQMRLRTRRPNHQPQHPQQHLRQIIILEPIS